jgi:hypothetical protein
LWEGTPFGLVKSSSDICGAAQKINLLRSFTLTIALPIGHTSMADSREL